MNTTYEARDLWRSQGVPYLVPDRTGRQTRSTHQTKSKVNFQKANPPTYRPTLQLHRICAGC